MKKINIIISILVGIALLTACEDDRGSNPTLQEPTTFVLNTPSKAVSNIYDLTGSKSIELTCTQPDYGYPAVVTYAVQVALADKWEEESDVADATYQTLPTTFTTAKMNANTDELNKVIVKLAGWASESDYDGKPMSVFVRLYAHIGTNGYPIVSNVIELKVLPYYMDVTDAVPMTYYLLGGCIGDGKWGAQTGVSNVPMSLVKDYEYDPETGKGKFVYTGYFPANQGFKVVLVPGQWEEQWGNDGGKGINNPVHNVGGSSDFMVTDNGWYTVSLDTKENKMEIKKSESQQNPTEYATMTLNYGTETVTMTKTEGEHSHMWYADVVIATSSKAKFTSGETTWGGEVFPFGLSVEGVTISCKPGNYLVLFNDLEGCYYFKEKAE